MSVINKENISRRFEKPAEYFSGKRTDLIEIIPKECKTVLDVGCGQGEVWKNFSFQVSGIEINESAAQVARKNLREVQCLDLEKGSPPSFKDSPFDCLVFADVLEHLYDPWGVLLNFKSLLKKEGYVLLSVPNVRHYRVLRRLLFKGEFAYQESGVLDIDHVRFFTYKEMQRMLQSTGFTVVSLKRRENSSFKYSFVNRLFFGALKDFLAEQYYILAQVNR